MGSLLNAGAASAAPAAARTKPLPPTTARGLHTTTHFRITTGLLVPPVCCVGRVLRVPPARRAGHARHFAAGARVRVLMEGCDNDNLTSLESDSEVDVLNTGAQHQLLMTRTKLYDKEMVETCFYQTHHQRQLSQSPKKRLDKTLRKPLLGHIRGRGDCMSLTIFSKCTVFCSDSAARWFPRRSTR